MKFQLLMVLGALFSINCYAGSTYYINSSCSMDGNGSLPGCAVSAGGPGAYSHGTSLVWGTANTFLLKSGTTITDLPVIVRGTGTRIATYGGSACATVSRLSGTFVLSIGADDVTIDGLCITGNGTSAILNTVGARTQIVNSQIFGNRGGGVGIRFNNGSSNGVVTDSATYDIDDDGIGIGSLAFGTFTLIRHSCHDIDKRTGFGDCIQAYDGTGASLTVHGGVLQKETANKSAIRYSGSGTVTLDQGLRVNLVTPGPAGISMDGTGVLNLKSVYIRALPGSWGIVAHNSGASSITNTFIDGGTYGIWSSHPYGSLTISDGAVVKQERASIYHTSDGVGGALYVNSTILDAPTPMINVKGTAQLSGWGL